MSQSLRVIFAGTPDFAVPSLKALIDSPHHVVAVYTQPDRPKGRGKKLMQSPVKTCALAHDIPVYQPKSLKPSQEQAVLSEFNADLMVVAAYGLILPKAVLDTPRLGCINVHASLLPRWRGASPIQQALLHGDSESGITIMQMDVGLDTGDMLLKRSCAISLTENAQSLHDKLAALGGEALLETIAQISAGCANPIAQDDELATYAPKIAKEDGRIDWSQSASQILNQIRAYNPWPVAYTEMGEWRLRIFEAGECAELSDKKPGELLINDAKELIVACGQGAIIISELQLPGAKRMSAKDCLNAKAALFAKYRQFV